MCWKHAKRELLSELESYADPCYNCLPAVLKEDVSRAVSAMTDPDRPEGKEP